MSQPANTRRQDWKWRNRSSYTAARFLSMYKPPPRNSVIADAMENARHYREVVLSKIGRLCPKKTTDIHVDVTDDWGEAHVRRTFSALRRLVEEGLIKRTADGYLLTRVR
jgi:hypothetical protein